MFFFNGALIAFGDLLTAVFVVYVHWFIGHVRVKYFPTKFETVSQRLHYLGQILIAIGFFAGILLAVDQEIGSTLHRQLDFKTNAASRLILLTFAALDAVSRGKSFIKLGDDD